MLIRFLDNDELSPEQVNELRDDIEYYISQCGEPELAEVDDIYDELENQLRESGVSFDAVSCGSRVGVASYAKDVYKLPFSHSALCDERYLYATMHHAMKDTRSPTVNYLTKLPGSWH